MKVFLVALVLITIAFLFIGIKMFFVKGGQFKKECSSTDPTSGKPADCACSSDGQDEKDCEFYEQHHGTAAKKLAELNSATAE